jgi:hypothetical protein
VMSGSHTTKICIMLYHYVFDICYMWAFKLINPYLEICHFEVSAPHFVTLSHVILEVFMVIKIHFGAGRHCATSRKVEGSRPNEVNFFSVPNIYFRASA